MKMFVQENYIVSNNNYRDKCIVFHRMKQLTVSQKSGQIFQSLAKLLLDVIFLSNMTLIWRVRPRVVTF